MEVCLFSNDKKLRELFHEVVDPVHLRDSNPDCAELCVFDFEPTKGLPAVKGLGSWNHLFLVDPKDLPVFSQYMEGKPVCLLLKPVTRAAVEAFFESCRERWAEKSKHHETEAFRSDRDELLQQLLQANLRLQQYDQERTNFLARALHDLRAPLTSIRGICGLLLEGEVGSLNPQQRDLLQRVQSSGRRLSRMSSGMFELSVQGRVQRALRLEPADLEACVNRALQEVSSQVQEKQIQVVSRVPNSSGILIDSEQIDQILINLLENACKFTPRGGKIEIQGNLVSWDFRTSAAKASGSAPNAYKIEVRDSGPGIPQNMLEAIFEQYTSLTGGEDRSGGGLGLAICKLAASAHGGKIWATSNHEGAIFSLVLPYDPRVSERRPRPLTSEGRPLPAQAV